MEADLCRVLVVDDNVDAADMTVMLLQQWGHESVAAYSAARCLAVAKDFDPDVVLMDIGMPGKDGFDANRELQQLIPGVKVIALTGWTRADIVRRTRQEGFADHLVKPVEPAELKGAVDDQCAISKAAP